jgi:hypothetical protein
MIPQQTHSCSFLILEQLEKEYHKPCWDRYGSPCHGAPRKDLPAIQHPERQQIESRKPKVHRETHRPNQSQEPFETSQDRLC